LYAQNCSSGQPSTREIIADKALATAVQLGYFLNGTCKVEHGTKKNAQTAVRSKGFSEQRQRREDERLMGFANSAAAKDQFLQVDREQDHMPDTRVSYQCECGKRWTITPSETEPRTTLTCKCGRTIVVRDGLIYGTIRPTKAKG
jgi:hypothetical protein